MNATTPLRQRLGRIPYRYSVDEPLNDYQATIEGPAGRAIITTVYDGEDYAIQTMFYGQSIRQHSVREWCGDSSPDMALNYVVSLNNTYLVNSGEEIPPVVDPRRIVAVVVLVAVLIFLGTLAVTLLTGVDSDGHRPTAPVTYSPAQTLEGPR